VSLWTLRPEDDVYVEVARSENGHGHAFPAPPEGVRKARAVRDWAEALRRIGAFAWEGDPARTRPGAGDQLVVPLVGHGAPHWIGFLLARLQAPVDTDATLAELERWAALARLALEAGSGQVPFLAGLDEIQEQRRQVDDLHRLKSQFIAAVSHELRTPLTSISAYAETLQSLPNTEPSSTRDRFLQVIHDESRRLARIVDDILNVATMDAGRVRLACRRVDLVDVIASALDIMRPIAERKGIAVVARSSEPAAVHADPDLLKQLVVNLVDNAVKFSDDGGEIRVILEREPSAVRCIVEDDGPGIPTDELDAIFERFYQIDGSNARRHGGSGLGLAICRSIATWHDGRIWAESGSGRGARLVVSLPRTRAVGRSRAASPELTTEQREEHRVPELIIEMIAEVVGAEAVSLMLLDEAENELYIQAAVGVPDEAIRDARVALGERISGHVAKTGETIEIPDLARDERFPMGNPDQYRTRSLLSVPVLLRGKPIGVINVTNTRSGDALTDHDRRLVQMLARRVALVVQKLREYGDRRESIERMENALRSVIDVRRHYFPSRENHARLVLELCEELGLDSEETARIHYASILRDVGMLRLPEGVYRKPVRLTRSDFEAIRRHPEEGARSIRPIEFQADVFDVILSHHEEHDGSGYPRGLTGAGIPRGARILAVVDAYDALRTGRPYKKAVGAEAAIRELQEHAGTQFDEAIVDALVRVLARRSAALTGPDEDRHDGSNPRPEGGP
jgi:signal transduction histidine kinase/putative methionine-R-sulfoxide reductase with GAF domain